MSRVYRPVLAEITTALFLCPDCGAVVWYSAREQHDEWHGGIAEAVRRNWLASLEDEL